MRIIKTRFVDLNKPGMHPRLAKKLNSKLHITRKDTFGVLPMCDFSHEQPIGKVIITGKDKYRILNFIGPIVKKFEGLKYQYELIKI